VIGFGVGRKYGNDGANKKGCLEEFLNYFLLEYL